TFPAGSGTATINLPAGPYLRVQGTGVTLTLKLSATNQLVLTADFALEQVSASVTTGNATTTASQVRVGVSKLHFSFGDGTNNLIDVTQGSGFFVIATGGLAGTVSASVASDVSGVSLSGTFGVSVNTTSAAVNESFMVGA